MLKTVIRQIRRNHALEHATINILGSRNAGARAAGHSGPWGFVLYTDLPLEEVVESLKVAQERLVAGNRHLAYHERCGTNVVVTATLSTFATLLGLGGKPDVKSGKFWWERLPLAILLNAIALIFAPQLAAAFQKQVTTDANIGDLKVTSVLTNANQGMRRIQVRTE